MLQVLEFIFRSFWTWLGAAILLEIIFGGVYRSIYSILYDVKKNIDEKEKK